MKIVVTGAAGFIGSHLCERLLKDGCRVIGIDNFNGYYDPKIKRRSAQILTDQGLELADLDLCDGGFRALLEDADAVFHLAGQPGLSSHIPFSEYLRNNVQATAILLEECQRLNKPPFFINISTSSVYGSFAVGDEETPPSPTSFYGVTKLCAEQLVLAAARSHNFPGASVRIFSVYGERERPEKFFPKLINSILSGQSCLMFEGSLAHERSFTYVGDIVSGLLSLLGRSDKCQGQIFNLGSPHAFKLAQAVEIVESILGAKARFDIAPARIGDQISTCANISKASEWLHYVPNTPLEVGIEREVEWFRKFPFERSAS